MGVKNQVLDDKEVTQNLFGKSSLKHLFFTGNHHPRSSTGRKQPCFKKKSLEKDSPMKV